MNSPTISSRMSSERHQPLDVAVLVDDEGHAALVALKIQQLRIERGARRHEVRLAGAGRLGQRIAIQAAARQLVHHLLHVQDADDAVDFPSIHRQPGVLALAQLFDDPVPVVVDIDADDLVARHHDVFDGGVFQIQDADQHLLVAMRNHGAGLRHDGAQFLAAQGIRGLLRRDAEQAQTRRWRAGWWPTRRDTAASAAACRCTPPAAPAVRDAGRRRSWAPPRRKSAAPTSRRAAPKATRNSPPRRSAMKPTSIGAATLTMVLNNRIKPIRRSGWASSRLREPRAAISCIGAMPEAVAVQAHERRFAAGEKCREDQQSRQRAEQQS